jgi:putative SOS response-associated peptidase YedK
MTDCNEAVRPVQNRMPVLLEPHEYDVWLRGSFEDIVNLQLRCFPDELIRIERTSEP